MPKSLYLASPYGFSQQQKQGCLEPLVSRLESLGAQVWEPFTKAQQIAMAAEPGWAHRIGNLDLEGVRQCDGIFAVVNGCPPDEGVMVELGYAMALKKAIFLFRDDFRRCSDSEEYPLNLMIFANLPIDSWKNHYFESLEELDSPHKNLTSFLKTGI